LKLLVDESLPVGLAAELWRYDVSTVRAQRWLGLKELRPLLPRIEAALAQVKKGELIEVSG
jgi:hypothetical protein